MLKKFLRKIKASLAGQVDIEALKKRGLKIGHSPKVLSHVKIDPYHCWHITIGDEVTLAPRVHILAHDASMKTHLGYTRIGNVEIGSRVFVGVGAIILPGVSIGDDVIIGAGSIVSKDIPPRCVAVGNPARVICSIESFLERHKTHIETLECFGEEYTIRGGITQQMKENMKQRVGKHGYVV